MKKIMILIILAILWGGACTVVEKHYHLDPVPEEPTIDQGDKIEC